MDAVEKSELRLLSRGTGRLIVSVLSIAAGLALLTGSYFIFLHESEQPDTFDDPEIAYAETLKILYNVSETINSGRKALEPVGKMQVYTEKGMNAINRPAVIIDRKMRSLRLFREAVEMVDNGSAKSVNN